MCRGRKRLLAASWWTLGKRKGWAEGHIPFNEMTEPPKGQDHIGQQGPGSLFHLFHPHAGLLLTCIEQTEPMPGTLSCGESTKVLGSGTGHLPSGLRPLLPPGSGRLWSKLTHAASMQKPQPKHPGGLCYIPSHQPGPAHTKLWLGRNRSAYLVGITGQS